MAQDSEDLRDVSGGRGSPLGGLLARPRNVQAAGRRRCEGGVHCARAPAGARTGAGASTGDGGVDASLRDGLLSCVGSLVFAPWHFRLARPLRCVLASAVLYRSLLSPYAISGSPFFFEVLAREAHDALASRKAKTGALAWLAAAALLPASLYKFLPELAAQHPELPAFIASANHRLRYLILGSLLGSIVLLWRPWEIT